MYTVMGIYVHLCKESVRQPRKQIIYVDLGTLVTILPRKRHEMEVETTKYSNDVYISDTEYSTRLWQAKHDKSRLSSKSPIESQ